MKFDFTRSETRKSAPRRETGAQKKFRLELGAAGLAAWIGVLCLGLAWVFVFGVLVGRGYAPEKHLPEMAAVLPKSAPKTPEPPAPEQPAPKTETPAPEVMGGGVVKAEDLKFFSELKKREDRTHFDKEELKDANKIELVDAPVDPKKDPKKDSKTKVAEVTPPKADPVKPTETKFDPKKDPKLQPPATNLAAAKTPPTDQNKTVRGEPFLDPKKAAPSDPKLAQTKPGDPKNVDPKAENPNRRYAYTYQAASVADAKSAEAAREKVRARGYKADVEQAAADGKTIYRIVVHFTGKPEETRKIKDDLADLAGGKLLMRSKTPVM